MLPRRTLPPKAWLVALTLGAGVAAAPAAEARGAPRAVRPSDRALSVGSPTDGMLLGGVALEPGRAVRLRWPEGSRWALPELVELIARSARRVHARFPGAVLLVGDLSARGGGALGGHASHQSGRDADLAFYYVDAEGRSVRTERLLPVRPSGRAAGMPELRFDDSRNWALVEALLADPKARVQKIFVAEPLRRRLLDHARRAAPRAVAEQAARVLQAPVRGAPHDDHFHVRIDCPPAQEGACVPTPGGAPLRRGDRAIADARGARGR